MKIILEGVQIIEIADKPPKEKGKYFGKLEGISMQDKMPSILPIYRYGLTIHKDGEVIWFTFPKLVIILMKRRPFIVTMKVGKDNDYLLRI